ncbi:MAG: proprotein convertase P-domain-containing protein, partial [Bacteroidales bacterium]|nr:proprotein convertase P-domain-containing protein [Bacteroidales bacterium]
MKHLTLLTLFFALMFSLSFGQKKLTEITKKEDNSVLDIKWGTESHVIQCSQFNITKPLREMMVPDASMLERKSYPFTEWPDKRDMPVQTFRPEVRAGDAKYGNDPSIIQTEQGKTLGKAPIQNWDGMNSGSFRPHDPTGAAGPNHYMQAINGDTYQIWDKTGTVLGTGAISALWSPAGGDGDPIILYDKDADRFFMAQFAGGGNGNDIFIGVSVTPDPTGSWYTYKWTSPDFPDYLKFAAWHDGYYMTANFAQKIYAFNRTKMLGGDGTAEAVYQTFSPPQSGFFVPAAADASDGTFPTTGPCPIFCYQDDGWTGVTSDAVNIYDASMNWGSLTMAVNLNTSLNTSAFDASYDPGWDDVAQPGTTQLLDGIGGAMMFRTQWKTWSGYNTVVTNWAVQVTPTQRGIFWSELRQDQTTGNWSIYQQGIYAPGTDNVWMGSIAMNDAGHIALAYNKTNVASTVYMSLAYAGRLSCDPLGTLPITEVIAMPGAGYQTTLNRVGDYAQTSLDPDGTTFWHTGEYIYQTASYTSADTRVYSFQLPGACAPPTVSNVSPTSLFEDRGKQITITGSDLDGCTFDIGGVTGTVVSNDGSTAVIDFPPGNYTNSTLTVLNAQGSDTWAMTVSTRNTIPVVAGAGVTSDDHPTIQSAVDGLFAWYGTTAFNAGDLPGAKIIEVAVGTYTEGITLNSGLTPDATNTLTIQPLAGNIVIVDATGNNYGFDLSTVNYVILTGFTVHSADLDNIYAQGNTVTIQYNKTYGSTGGSGIKVETGTPFTVANNLSYTNYNYGIHVNSSNNFIKNNTVDDNGHNLTGTQTLLKSYTTPSVSIPDNGCPGTVADATINVPENVTITNVRVLNMNITHTWDGDLEISLIHPDATSVSLCLSRGGNGDNFTNTNFDDAAGTAISAGTAPFTGTFTPETALSALDTKTSTGNWNLRVCDGASADIGSIESWQLEISYSANEQIGSGIYVGSVTGNIVENNISVAKAGSNSYYALQSPANSLTSNYNTYYTTNTNLFDYNGTIDNTGPLGANDLTGDPVFIGGGDYHIFSTADSYAGGEWPPTTATAGTWTTDASDSPAIDAGNTADAFANEPAPNGSLINQGAYGNTPQASKSNTVVCTYPTAQATSFSVDATNNNDVTVSWTRGTGGDAVIVLVHETVAVDSDPVDGVTYTANTIFASGTQIGVGNYVVLDANATSVTVTGLTASTTYHFAIYEYSTTGNCYLVPALTGNATTTSPPTYNWTGTTNSDWFTTTNWSSGIIPSSTDDVTIPNVTNQPFIDNGIGTVAVCNNMTIDASASVTIDVTGYMTVSGAITNNAGTAGLVINS